MKRNTCSHCGKELGAFGKVKIKNGYLCKKCSKKYKKLLEREERAFESLTYDEIISIEEEDNKRTNKVLIYIAVGLALMIGLMFLLGTCEDDKNATNEEKTVKSTTEKNTEAIATKDTYDYGSMENPRDIGFDDISNLREGEYVRITAPGHLMCSSDGRIRTGEDGELLSKSGVELLVEKGDEYYHVDAIKVSPGDFADTFKTRNPMDFSTESETEGELSHYGSIFTIVGEVESVDYSEEYNNLMGFTFSRNSVIENIEFFK